MLSSKLQSRIAIILFLISSSSFSQELLYSLNRGRNFISEEKILEIATTRKENGFKDKEGMAWLGFIYHKEQRKDTIINYVHFRPGRINDNEERELLTYKQSVLWSYQNKQLPDFAIPGYNGKTLTNKDFLGKPTLINLWGTFCKPCIAEMPELNKLKEEYQDRVNFVSITGDNKESLAQFLKIQQFDYNHLIGPDALKYYRKVLNTNEIPKNLFIDAKGVLRYIEGNVPLMRKAGEKKSEYKIEMFEELLEKLIAENN